MLMLSIPAASYAASDGQADLSVAASDSRDPVDMSDPTYGGVFTYSVVVTNSDADDAASGVVLTDTVVDKPGAALPLGSPLNITPTQGADISNFSTTQGTCSEAPVYTTISPLQTRQYGERISCDLGSLAPGASATVTIEVTTNLNNFVVPQPAGVIANLAQLTSTTADPDTKNNTDVQPTVITRALI